MNGEAAFAGGCQCGAVRYRISGPRLVVYACHCRECQRQSSSAFALSIPLHASEITVTGTLATYTRATDSGSKTECLYCPSCGVRILHRSARAPENVTLKGGTLDDTSGLVPVAHLWISRKQPWVRLDPSVPAFETQPADLKAWRDGLLASRA